MSILFFDIQLRSSQYSNLSPIRMSKYRSSIVSRTLLRFVNTTIKRWYMIVYLPIFVFVTVWIFFTIMIWWWAIPNFLHFPCRCAADSDVDHLDIGCMLWYSFPLCCAACAVGCLSLPCYSWYACIVCNVFVQYKVSQHYKHSSLHSIQDSTRSTWVSPFARFLIGIFVQHSSSWK